MRAPLSAALLLTLGSMLVVAGVGLANDASDEANAGAAQQRRAFMPHPARGPQPNSDARLDLNQECVNCHADLAGEWSHSLHRRAYEDPMVQAAFAKERDPSFCRSCHAPEADPRNEPTDRQAAAGVACVTCHLDGHDEVVLAGPARAGTKAAPHPLRRTQDFASPAACASCHEFNFPHASRRGHALKMQRTVFEHARSDHADTSCQGCHMPMQGSGDARHRHHGFAVAGQRKLLASAVSVQARRASPERVVLELSPAQVGHAVPTGDLFRRLRVQLQTIDEGPPWSAQRVLTRRFGSQRVGPGQVVRVELEDDRVGIGAGPRVVRFELPSELHGRPLRWELALERALDASTGTELRATVWDSTTFLSGEL